MLFSSVLQYGTGYVPVCCSLVYYSMVQGTYLYAVLYSVLQYGTGYVPVYCSLVYYSMVQGTYLYAVL